MTLVADPVELLLRLARGLVSFFLSVGAHVLSLLPLFLAGLLYIPPELVGEEDGADEDFGEGGSAAVVSEEAPVEAAPVRVTLYEEVIVAATVSPTPTTKPTQARPPDPVEAGPGEEVAETTTPPAGGEVVPSRKPMGKQPRGAKKPCELVEEIVKSGEGRWQVERELIDYYATHLKELYRQGSVTPNVGADGNIRGVRVSLPRCSVVRQLGLRSGDIVDTVNGRKVETLAQAIGLYFALRNERVIEVSFRRKGTTKLFIYTLVR